MKHKIKIWSEQMSTTCRRWYVRCLNDHCSDWWVVSLDPDGFFGRKVWDAALALGIAHQQEYEPPSRPYTGDIHIHMPDGASPASVAQSISAALRKALATGVIERRRR